MVQKVLRERESERKIEREREQSTYNQKYSNQVVHNIQQPTRMYTFYLDPIIYVKHIIVDMMNTHATSCLRVKNV